MTMWGPKQFHIGFEIFLKLNLKNSKIFLRDFDGKDFARWHFGRQVFAGQAFPNLEFVRRDFARWNFTGRDFADQDFARGAFVGWDVMDFTKDFYLTLAIPQTKNAW